MPYAIRAAVQGGVTGYRESWVERDGKTLTFDTWAAAQARADELNATTPLHGGYTPSGRPIAVAIYRAMALSGDKT